LAIKEAEIAAFSQSVRSGFRRHSATTN